VLRPCILFERFPQTYWTYHLALPDGWRSHGDHLEHLTTIRRRTFKGVFLLMNIRFYIDPETVLPHIYGHRVDEREVENVLREPGEDRPGREDSRVAIGQTRAGRYIRVIYVPDPEPDSVFVITAYQLTGKPLMAYRRRRRRKL